MRKLLLSCVLVLAVPAGTLAAPVCSTGALDSYIALGGTGCAVGAYTFSSFTATVLLGGATPIDPAAVRVAPLAGPGLEFGFVESAGAGDLLDILIRFTLAGPALGSSTLSMTGSAASGDGVVTGIQDTCRGASFADGDPTSCPGPNQAPTLIVLEDQFDLISPDSTTFASSSPLDVYLNVTVDGGLSGAASLDGSVRTLFGPATPPVDAPEPYSLVLIGLGVAGCAARRARGR